MKPSKFIIPLLLVLSACTKQVPGPKGDPGLPGGNGNTDQAETTNFLLASAAWSASIKDSSLSWEAVVFVPAVTKLALDEGKIRTFVSDHDLWWPLPYSEKEKIVL